MTPPAANIDPRLRGEWVNHEEGWGYHLTNRRAFPGPFKRVKMVYDYAPDWSHPLYFLQTDGTAIAAGALPGSDQGSVPVFAQGWIPKDGSLGYYPHDFAYNTGGLFVRYRSESVFRFRQVTRSVADRLLRSMVQHDPVNPMGMFRAAAVWAAVRVAGWRVWHSWKPGDDVPRWPVEERPDVDDPLPMGVG